MAIPAIRYLALGDSFTIATGLSPDRSFPARLADRWRARGRSVDLLNLGVNGYTTADLIREELPRVRAFAPTFVTLMIGTNDIVRGGGAAGFRRNLATILDRLAHEIATERVLVLPAPDWSRSPEGARYGDPDAIARGVDAQSGVALEEAARAGARFLDLVPLSREQSARGLFAPDGLHFGVDAYAEWAARIDDATRAWC